MGGVVLVSLLALAPLLTLLGGALFGKGQAALPWVSMG